MTWMKVDDTFHAHPKVLATDPAALGLWVVAGSWSSAHLTEGFVPDHVLPRLLPDSAELARKLVTAGLWRKVRGGHQFHDWTVYNPTKEAVEADRKANAERQRRYRSVISARSSRDQETQDQSGSTQPADIRRTKELTEESAGQVGQRNGVTHGVTNAISNAVSNSPPTRPDPTPIGGSSLRVTYDRARATQEPPRTCAEHANNPNPPRCGPCGDARRIADRWRAERDARIAEAPRCRDHPGEVADNCRWCAAEAKGAA